MIVLQHQLPTGPAGWYYPNVLRQYTHQHYYCRQGSRSLCSRHNARINPIADYSLQLQQKFDRCTDCSRRLDLLRRIWSDLLQPVDE